MSRMRMRRRRYSSLIVVNSGEAFFIPNHEASAHNLPLQYFPVFRSTVLSSKLTPQSLPLGLQPEHFTTLQTIYLFLPKVLDLSYSLMQVENTRTTLQMSRDVYP